MRVETFGHEQQLFTPEGIPYFDEQLEAEQGLLGQIETLLADAETGLSPAEVDKLAELDTKAEAELDDSTVDEELEELEKQFTTEEEPREGIYAKQGGKRDWGSKVKGKR